MPRAFVQSTDVSAGDIILIHQEKITRMTWTSIRLPGTDRQRAASHRGALGRGIEGDTPAAGAVALMRLVGLFSQVRRKIPGHVLRHMSHESLRTGTAGRRSI